MSLITVDRDKCRKDGICVSTCPLRLIEQRDQNSMPVSIAQAEELCVECGHCVAVCPHGALSHPKMPAASCPHLKEELRLSPEHVEHFLRARRSIRSYRDIGVDREVITKLIDIARYAPSGHNIQQVKWHIIYDSTEVKRLAAMVIDWCRHLIEKQSPFVPAMHLDLLVAAWDSGREVICQGAPHVIVTHAHAKDGMAPTSCTIALTYLDLAATAFGLGTCWAGLFNLAANVWMPMKEALDLPQRNAAYGAMILGHPKIKYHRLPLRKDPTITWK